MQFQPIRYAKATLKKWRVLRRVMDEMKEQFHMGHYANASNLIDRYYRIKYTI